MPPRGYDRQPPRAYLTAGSWPDGSLAADAPPAVLYAAEISRRLREAIGDQPLQRVAEASGVARSSLYDILGGARWPDVFSLAKFEVTLGARLWPDNPIVDPH